MQINDDFYEDLTPETTIKVLEALGKGERPKPGPQSSRRTSENSAGMTTLMETVSQGFLTLRWVIVRITLISIASQARTIQYTRIPVDCGYAGDLEDNAGPRGRG